MCTVHAYHNFTECACGCITTHTQMCWYCVPSCFGALWSHDERLSLSLLQLKRLDPNPTNVAADDGGTLTKLRPRGRPAPPPPEKERGPTSDSLPASSRGSKPPPVAEKPKRKAGEWRGGQRGCVGRVGGEDEWRGCMGRVGGEGGWRG